MCACQLLHESRDLRVFSNRAWVEMLANREATSHWPATSRNPVHHKPAFGYNAAWGVSLKFAGAFPHRTLVWLAFAVALALTALPLVLLLRKGAQLARDVHELRLQVDLLEQQVLRLSEINRLLSLNLPSDLQQQLQPSSPAEEYNQDQGFKEFTSSGVAFLAALRQPDVPLESVSSNSTSAAFLLPSKNGSSSSSGSARLPRSTETLQDCPKPRGKKNPAPVFMHLHGDGDSQYETATGYITSWVEEEWCKYPANKRFIRHDKQLGGMLVTQPGLYLLYVQMTFVRFHQVAVFQVFAASTIRKEGERLIASCFVRTKELEFNLPVTCSTTVVVCLDSHDRVYVKETDNREVTIDMQRTSSFIGLYRLHAGEVKKGKTFCPTR